MRRLLGLLALVIGTQTAASDAPVPVEPPHFRERVAAGLLPPVAERLPRNPYPAEPASPGRHGGTLRLLMGRSKDVRLMVVYGYARLVRYDTAYRIVPDILERVDVEDDRVFTLHLRAGHRWSDGHPFTSEDFRYYWEDMANNADLSPFGVPSALLVEGEPPSFRVLDDRTVRYAWDRRNPFFLSALAGARPEFIYAPAHYLKRHHPRYSDPAALSRRAKAAGQPSWSALHARLAAPYKNDNPDLPSLQPWVGTTRPPAERFVFERNPFFHRVDPNGLQLPYIDRVVMSIADGRIIPAKTGAGEADLQARHIKFSDYTFLKESEERAHQRVRLWRTTKGAHMALFPNLNVEDPIWRSLLRDVRFRRALSLAINRREINQVIYYGLATEGNNTVQDGSPLYRDAFRTEWARFDPEQADRLLNQVGLTRRNDRGIRLLPDGRPAAVIVETAGEDTEQSDVLELIHDSWLRVGLKLYTKPLQREVLRNRIFSGQTLMAVWGGLENGIPTPDMSPEALAPTSQQQLQWPRWGQYFETEGSAGEPVDDPGALELLRLNRAWMEARDTRAREAAWMRMLAIHASQVFTLGLVAGVPQPVVVSTRLRNVPERGVYNWEPGAHFGVYRPDEFWFDEPVAAR